MLATLKSSWREVYAAHERNVRYLEARFVGLGLIGVVGFPLYYFVWRDVYPQPYENLGLRLAGMVFCLPVLLGSYWPSHLRKYLPAYTYIVLLYALPFFFTFMLLMNKGEIVWVLSALCAVFAMTLMLDWLNLIIQFVLGVGAACLTYALTADMPWSALSHMEYLPIYAFALVFGAMANYTSDVVNKEQARAMLATASSIAHELRTPLLGITSGASGLRSFLPALLDAYRQAQAHGLDVQPIRAVHLRAMDGVLDRIGMEAYYSNTIIDMLLTSVSPTGLKSSDASPCSMAHCVDMALDRYPFATERERSLVAWDNESDFVFKGKELLMVHVLFNLLKNALRHIAKAGKGGIDIRIETGEKDNFLVFRDTGSGIAPSVLPHVFTRFYSWPAGGDSLMGGGIGLAFCRDVLRAFDGDITCNSQLGQFTEFTLRLPKV